MAKIKKPGKLEDFNFDDGLDIDKELGDMGMDFDMESDTPNSKSREPVSKSLSKFGSGFTDSAKEMMALDQAGAMARKALPKSLSNEMADLVDITSTVREKYRESIKEVKTAGRQTVAQLDKLIPAKGMFRNALDKIKNRLGDEDTEYGQADKNAMENETIVNALGEIFTENNKAERVQELVRQNIEDKRHKSSTELLATIASESEQSRKFNFEIANNFYRRSLEIQYRSLFIAKEQLDIMKATATGYKGQFESIIFNTSLPDILKYKHTENIRETLAQNARQQVADVFFSDANPITTLKKNLVNKLTDKTNEFKEGLTSANDMLDSANSANEMSSMAGGKSYLFGKMLGDFGRDRLLGGLGNKLGKTAKGKEAVFNVKTAMADPSAYFNNIANNDNTDGMFGDMKRSIYSTLGDLSNTNATNDTAFKKVELDSATMFDMRTKDSITKIIPGLLSKIFSEVKGIRTGKFTPDNDETLYDHDTSSFTTTKAYTSKIKTAIKTTFKDSTEYRINSLVDKLVSDGGVTFSKKDIAAIQKGMFKYIIDGGSISANALVSDKFLGYYDNKLAGKLKTAGTELLAMGKHDPEYLDSVQYDLKSIKESIPNINQKLQKLYASGLSGIGVSLGGMKYDSKKETFVYDKNGAKNMLSSLYGEAVKNSDKVITPRDKYEVDQTTIDPGAILQEIKDDLLAKGRKTRKIMTPTGFKEALDDSELGNKFVKAKDEILTKTEEYKKQYQDYDVRGKYNEVKSNAKDFMDEQKQEIHSYLKEKYPGIDDITIETIYAEGKKKYRGAKARGKLLKRSAAKEFEALEIEVAKKHEALSKIAKEEYSKTKRSTLKNYASAKRQINKKLTSKEFVKLREQFYNTPEYVNGKMTDLDEWLKSQNYDTTNIKEFNVGGMASDVAGVAKNTKDKVLASDKAVNAKAKYEELYAGLKEKVSSMEKPDFEVIKQNLAAKFGEENVEKAKALLEKLKVSKKKTEQKAIVETLDIMAEKQVVVEEAIAETKKTRKAESRFDKLNLGTRVSQAHSIDKLLLKGGFGLLGKALKFGVKAPWLAGKYGVKGLKAGYNAYNSEGVQNALGTTRSLDGMLMRALPSILGSVVKAPFKMAGAGISGIGKAGKWMFGKEQEEEPKKNIFDSDNSGERDGSWKDRLNIFGKKSKDKTPGAIGPKEKSGGILGMLGAALPMLIGVLGKVLSVGGKLVKVLFGLPGMLLKVIPKIGKALLAGGSLAAKGIGVVATAGATAFGIGSKLAVGVEAGTAAATAAPKSNKIMSLLNSFKEKIFKKLGPKAGAKLAAILASKIAARIVPVIGTALLAYDAAMIGKDMIMNDTDLASAVSKQILGFDLFSDTDAALDENGDPIKPDENLDIDEVKDKDENSNSGFFGRITDDIKSKAVAAKDYVFDKAVDLKNSAVTTATNIKDNVVSGATNLYDGAKEKASNFFGSGTFNNGALGTTKESILNMLDTVAKKTGVDANILKTFAAVESGLNPNDKAKTSSAAGLFQFLTGTWNDMISKYGGKYGLTAGVSPYDAEANATMGAEYIKENSKIISSVKPNPTVTDLYLAHFLGAGGAKTFFKSDPNAVAANIMPGPAKANFPIFYRKDGTPKTISEIYADLNKKMQDKAVAFGFKPATVTEDSIKTPESGPTNGLDAVKEAANNVPVVSRAPSNNSNYNPTDTGIDSASTQGDATPVTDKPVANANVSQPQTLSTGKVNEVPNINGTANTTLISLSADSNSALNRIDKTLTQSLEAQIRMVTALEKIVTNYDKNLSLIGDAKAANAPANTTDTPRKNVSSSDMPTGGVSVARNMYSK